MRNPKDNFILATDAYKQSHWKQTPVGTKRIYSYLESRGGKYPATLFFGLQAIIKKHLQGVVVEQWMIDEADDFCQQMFGADYFNREGWQRIVDVHGGKLPIRIRAVKEGSIVPTGNMLIDVENLDDQLPFLTNFIETLLMQVWYPTTVATTSFFIKKLISEFCEETGEDVSPFHLNDFGFRGATCKEAAGLGGAAHLVNFMGTDTLEGIRYAMHYYNEPKVVGYSVMASEHSTTTIYGKENEQDAYEAFLDRFPTGILSIVSDSFDYYYTVREIFGKNLRDKILNRDGKFVVRPDSGYPPKICVETLDMLYEAFGGTVNSKGYKVLNPKVGIIYGDGIDYEMIRKILIAATGAGYAASNVIFGMGGALLQQVNRDTQKFAFKCSAALIDEEWRDVYKDPVTDKGKRSKRGKLSLMRKLCTCQYNTIREGSVVTRDQSTAIQTVFENGELVYEETFEAIRKRADADMVHLKNYEFYKGKVTPTVESMEFAPHPTTGTSYRVVIDDQKLYGIFGETKDGENTFWYRDHHEIENELHDLLDELSNNHDQFAELVSKLDDPLMTGWIGLSSGSV